MIHSLRFIEKEVPVSVGGEVTLQTRKILQFRTSDVISYSDGQSIEHSNVSNWEDVDTCLDILDPNVT